MKRISILALAAATATGILSSMPFTVGRADDGASPIFGVKIPDGYRAWEMVAVSHEAGLDELRGILGNPVAIKAYRDGTLPFPDGTILAKLAWKHVPLAGAEDAFVPGSATTVQIMVKDSQKYASTDGWGFGRFIDGKPAVPAQNMLRLPRSQRQRSRHRLHAVCTVKIETTPLATISIGVSDRAVRTPMRCFAYTRCVPNRPSSHNG